jgi:two-component system phosphate regulon sensor histidine kinase PhoR
VRARHSGKHVLISVVDNGPGIAPAEHKRIFQKFYRVDDRLSRDREGSGLGLAIVKHVVRAHNGRVELTSALGKGSTFTIALPALAQRAEASKAPSPGGKQAWQPPRTGTNPTP